MNLEQKYITSLEVSEMVEKPHNDLLKDVRRYIANMNEGNISHVDFFTEGTYKDAKGETRPCFNITKKGCEFIANKLTGVKGTAFTARYINRFHEMEDTLKVPMTTTGQIQLLAQGHVELEQRVNAISNDFNAFKTEMPLLAVDTERITVAKNKVVIELMGGKKSNAYNNSSLRSKVYSDLSNQIKREFGVSSYRAIRRNQTDKAVEMILNYKLPIYLKEQVDFENSQMNL